MKTLRFYVSLAFALVVVAVPSLGAQGALVLQSDFGLRDGAVASMKGVAVGVNGSLRIFDLTHEIAPFDIWEAAYRLKQVTPFWPSGTVFVSIVDPGVGTARKAIVARLKNGQLFVTPDNGTLTLLAGDVQTVREIDVARQRLPGSEKSHTFHGRDVFAYVGARLAAGTLRFDDVGPEFTAPLVLLPVTAAHRDGKALVGMISMIDRPYGNVWTNVSAELAEQAGWRVGDTLRVEITHGGGRVVARLTVPYATSFGFVRPGEPVAYVNSLLDMAIALNQGSLAGRYRIGTGPAWTVRISKK